ncbi:hypothetical protein FDC58_12075 [Clostridium botulinum]|nr:hypothetical protein [Clostridium botulinum]NFP29957.1 hypothetical protein [Clostridium botulinum]
MDQYGLVENEDYSISQICEKGHRPRIEFAISLDMAKELSMVEKMKKTYELSLFWKERISCYPIISLNLVIKQGLESINVI